jgi:hypothetical protein
VVNPNFQQPYYQTEACGPSSQVCPESYFTTPAVMPTIAGGTYSGMSDNVRGQVTRTLREFGMEPMGHARTYQKPYPEFFNNVPYPRGFWVPDFAKCTGSDSKTTYEHVGQFLAQVNEIGINDVHKVRLFPLSLSGMTFNWFAYLPANSVDT